MNIDTFRQECWPQIRDRLLAWWQHEGLVLHILAPGDSDGIDSPNTQAPFYYQMAGLDTTATYPNLQALETAWIDPVHRLTTAERFLPHIYYGGDAFPFFDTHLGPGNLAAFLGSTPKFALDTVWFKPSITDTDNCPPLRFDPDNIWFQCQKAILEAGMAAASGRFPVSMPDLIENLDTLASLRGTEELMLDLVERPAFVQERLSEINQVYFAVFDHFYTIIKDEWGGNVFSAFAIWGPGKTAKVQCDVSAMISPRMFRRFVVQALAEQCAWLDYAMYHLDGTQAVCHLEALLEMDGLDAIEWTPQVSVPQGGDPQWFPMYRRILAAGKSLQLVGIRPTEVIPILDAIGPRGVFIMVNANSEAEADALTKSVEAYR